MARKTKIGKDVIDSLALSMYEDARFVFREYIQNSADQIDIAFGSGLFKSKDDGLINISISKSKKEILIADNATGIESAKVESVLKNVAQSSKKLGINKGFRGIGRLGGIGYCRELIFETSYKGESVKTILKWDADLLSSIINDRSKNEEAVEVIDRVTTTTTEKEKVSEHYFKVYLVGVKSNELLDVSNVREYLSMVAPVPYESHFVLSDKIYKKCTDWDVTLDEYQIIVNNDQIFKPYTSTVYEPERDGKKRVDEIKDLKFFEIQSADKKKKLAFGWYGISNFEKQIPSINIARGIRLRKDNIQIGDSRTLIKLFKESRGNYYFFGEVFAVDKYLIPNARRDYFRENETLKEFENELRYLLHNELHQLYYYASQVRSATKKIEKLASFKKYFEEKATKSGFTNDKEKKRLESEFEKYKASAQKAEKELSKLSSKISTPEDPKSRIFKNITAEKKEVADLVKVEPTNGKTKYATDELSRLSSKDRKLVSKVFSVIDKVLTPDLAANLKEKIKQEFR
jgi:Skp family chaperone for outer membrane proteins